MHDTTGCHDLAFSRRIFLQRGVVFASLAATVPLFIERSARALAAPLGAISSVPGAPQDRILVVVQLGGGNDGLSTVVPFGDDRYYTARPMIAIPPPGRENGALAIPGADGVGIHPNLSGFKELLDEGVASIVQGVGYPNPNRSHFASMDIWHTARTDGQGAGWIGRYFDHECKGTPMPEGAISIGREGPLAMIGEVQKPVCFESAEMFRWIGEDLHSALGASYEEINRGGTLPGVEGESQLGFLMRTALDAQVSSDRIRRAVSQTPLVSYPSSPLAGQLRLVAAMIRDGLATRVYYVSLGGFDTHANQPGTHSNLMRQLGDALNAFHKDLTAQRNSPRVLTMVFSEFGRRVAQNASRGTDHGTAAPMYLMGDMVRPGLLGEHPSLTQLDQGDLIHNVDFRSVYATILEKWMGTNAKEVLGGSFEQAQVLA